MNVKSPEFIQRLLRYHAPAIEAERDEVRKLLGLDPQANEFSVVYGSVAANDKEIALLTRSVLEILRSLLLY